MEEESYMQPSSRPMNDSFVQSPVSPSSRRLSLSSATMNTELETSFSDELDLPKHADYPPDYKASATDYRANGADFRPNGMDYRANGTDYNRATSSQTLSNTSVEQIPAGNTEFRSPALSNTAVISPSYVNNPSTVGFIPPSAGLSNGGVVQLPLHVFQQLQNAAAQNQQNQQSQMVSDGSSSIYQTSAPVFNPATYPRRQTKPVSKLSAAPGTRDTMRTSCGPLYEEISTYNRSLPDPVTTDPVGPPALTPDSKQYLISESADSSPQLSNHHADLSTGSIARCKQNELYDMAVTINSVSGQPASSDISTNSMSTKGSSFCHRRRGCVCAALVVLTLIAASALVLSLLLVTNVISTSGEGGVSRVPSRLENHSTTDPPDNSTVTDDPSIETLDRLSAQLALLQSQVDGLEQGQKTLTDSVGSIFESCQFRQKTHLYTGVAEAITTALMPNYPRADPNTDYIMVAASCGGANIKSYTLHESEYLNTTRKQYRCECVDTYDQDEERACTMYYWICRSGSVSS